MLLDPQQGARGQELSDDFRRQALRPGAASTSPPSEGEMAERCCKAVGLWGHHLKGQHKFADDQS